MLLGSQKCPKTRPEVAIFYSCNSYIYIYISTTLDALDKICRE